ncbi:hypothetical protein [Parenemella sanctibonifatiensis]|uniref:Uncharacterized protein n=1 Tax=Parenemella sanctibonifatiensis TaxID=2016505 RepID=A0A255E1S8_9ACTN|nr:hypothetical protein [Parenemella sanctibonifatiensis]OYN85290.1 hypothetical protein CGZ92_10835 [Parenemella sanctibonifatiensis]
MERFWFVKEDRVDGVLLRHRDSRALSTLSCFVVPDGLYHVESRISVVGEIRNWQHSAFSDVSNGVQHNWIRQPHWPRDTIPSFGMLDLVGEWLVHDPHGSRLPVTVLSESQQVPTPRPVDLVRQGDRITEMRGSEAGNSHRIADGIVVETEWRGNRTVLADQAPQQLPDQVAAAVADWQARVGVS